MARRYRRCNAFSEGHEMTEIDLHDDSALRFIQRVLESDAPQQDRKKARDMIVAIRTRIRKEYDMPAQDTK